MADHYNFYPMKTFAGTVAACMDFPLPDSYAPGVIWAADILKEKMGGPADRAILYHADAVGMHIWQKYTNLFVPVYQHTCLALPMLSTVESVTPVSHASMYTGLDPEVHGICTYVRPQLTCDTLFDQWIEAGKKVAIVAQRDSTFLHIFAGRKLDYFEGKNAIEVQEIALSLIEKNCYDIISIHTFDYDNAAHGYGPESKEGLNAISLEAEGFDRIARAVRALSDGKRTLLTYSPDHGQHPVPGGRGSHGSKQIEDMNVVHFFGAITP
ncbi:MAG: hypothetical protein E7324_06120 [Clostridiales bacterium]|nr:hypothetical protein [Clostridiales bacterium]